MCESNVWVRYPDGQTEKVADAVLYATQEGEEVVLRWFLKEPMRVTGRIVAVDAVKHTIMLEVSERLKINMAHEETDEQHVHAHEHEHEHEHEHPHPHSP